MSFDNLYRQWSEFNFEKYFETIRKNDILVVLKKDKLEIKDFLKLLSPTADSMLEDMAQKAHQLTIRNFGRVVLFFAPLYVSNYCDNGCLYCGFNSKKSIKRQKLNMDEVKKEAKVLNEKGIRHIILLTGGSRYHTPPEYIKGCINILKNYFSSISIEVYALKEAEYKKMIKTGVEGLSIYQEVYDQDIYEKLHPFGEKRNYSFRLHAPERACKAGMRFVNIGALLGLADWRKEAFFTGLHAYYLQNKYLSSNISLSIPRIKSQNGSFIPANPVSDRELVQIMLAYRIFLQRSGITLSTREKAELRDNLIPLGITQISAESSTAVGGYASDKQIKQFENLDNRTVDIVKKMVKAKGYRPIFKDWLKLYIKTFEDISVK